MCGGSLCCAGWWSGVLRSWATGRSGRRRNGSASAELGLKASKSRLQPVVSYCSAQIRKADIPQARQLGLEGVRRWSACDQI